MSIPGNFVLSVHSCLESRFFVLLMYVAKSIFRDACKPYFVIILILRINKLQGCAEQGGSNSDTLPVSQT